MTPGRLLTLMAYIGWGQHELARRTGRHRSTIQQWCGGKVRIPSDVAAWLEDLAAYLTQHPGPRRGTQITR